jgi:hypothetical protein
VQATGAGLRWQWFFNGGEISGATNATLLLSEVTLAQSGDYAVVVFNAGGAASAAATLTVLQPVTFLQQPVPVSVGPPTNATLSVSATGTAPLSYQWRLNGADIPGATAPTISFTPPQEKDDGIYTVVVSNIVGALESQPARLSVLIKPVMLLAPLNMNVVTGSWVTFSCIVTGSPSPMGFLWRQGSINHLVDITTNRQSFFRYFVTNAASLAGTWRVIITNAAHPTANAQAANIVFTLTVLTDSDGDGIADTWGTNYGFGTNTAAIAALDSDGDGLSNLAEFLAGTDPTNAASLLDMEAHTNTAPGVIQFIAQPSRTYSVQYVTNAASGTWTSFTNFSARTNAPRVERVTDPAPHTGGRFYRVVTPAAP